MQYALSVASQLGSDVRIWCDNAAVVKVMQAVLRGHRPPIESAHSDLVAALVRSGAEVDGSRISVHKVTSHCDLNKGQDELEVWAFWHNQLVDAAATSINARRDETFWQLWQAAATSLEFNNRVLEEVQKVLLRVGYADRQLRHVVGDPTASLEATLEVRNPPAVGEHVQSSGKWTIFPKLTAKYGVNNVTTIHEWWTTTGLTCLHCGQKYKWVSGLQLFVDFLLETNFGGPLARNHKLWFDDPETAPAEVPRGLASRSTRFLQVWGAYLKANSCVVAKRLMRPCAGSLAFWALCFYLPWPGERLDAVDAAIIRRHGRQVQRPNDLDVYHSLGLPP